MARRDSVDCSNSNLQTPSSDLPNTPGSDSLYPLPLNGSDVDKNSLSPSRPRSAASRRQSDSGLENAAKTVVLFPGSGTIAAATVGALGSVAAIATGGIALLGAGAAVCAFKFSPGLNKEESGIPKEERAKLVEEADRRLEERRKKEEEEALQVEANNKLMEEQAYAAVLNRTDIR